MKKKTVPPPDNSGRNLQIVLALIALAGTLVTALFGYLGVREQARGATGAHQELPAPITAVVAAPAASNVPIVQASSVVDVTEHWSNGGCGEWRVMPTSFDPTKRIPRDDSQITAWQLPPSTKLDLSIWGQAEAKEWLELSNTATITVSFLRAAPDTINVYVQNNCGAPGEIRDFGEVSLKSDFSSYTTRVQYPNVDFFTLQPGEFERMIFGFTCTHPGVYGVELGIPYKNSKNAGIIRSKSPSTIVCPTSSYTQWEDFLGSSEIYTFDLGTKYLRTDASYQAEACLKAQQQAGPTPPLCPQGEATP